jgi:cytochrome c
MIALRPPHRAGLILGILGTATAFSATWKYPGCLDVTDADFQYENLVQRRMAPDPSLEEPIKMAFDMGPDGFADVYWVERAGKVKVYRGREKTVSLLGQVGVASASEYGLLGIALDPGFRSNRALYLFYTPSSAPVFRLSRFALSGEALALGSEKTLLQYPLDKKVLCHSGGAMAFDAYGDLWLTTGANGCKTSPVDESSVSGSQEDAASNTADYRGGILRIHPDASAKGYSIPEGNFGGYFAAQAALQDNPSRAAELLDTARVRPEIYVKGMRNPYTLTLDPVRRWAMVGDVGPDNTGLMDEHDLFKAPGFAGWPYFAGKNLGYAGNKDPAAPVNLSKWNTGIAALPPAIPSLRSSETNCAIAGPLYRYDGASPSLVKLPPHFDRVWFTADFQISRFDAVVLNAAGDQILGEQQIFRNHPFQNPVDFQAGPDGALYVINYAGWFNSTSETSIQRISYHGPCRPASPVPELPVPLAGPGLRDASRGSPAAWIFFGNGIPGLRFPAGTHVQAYDLRGRPAWETVADEAGRIVPGPLAKGLYHLRIIAARSGR